MISNVGDDRPADRSLTAQRQDLSVFLDNWHGVAATLIDRHLTIVSSTPLGAALFPTMHPGSNVVREVFLGWETGNRAICAEDASGQVIAALQALIAIDDEDDEFRRIVGELSTLSRRFSTAWAHGAEPLHPSGHLRTEHPDIGEISLTYQLLSLANKPHDVLIVWQARDDRSDSALQRLVSR